jgi:hypothetical protein
MRGWERGGGGDSNGMRRKVMGECIMTWRRTEANTMKIPFGDQLLYTRAKGMCRLGPKGGGVLAMSFPLSVCHTNISF